MSFLFFLGCANDVMGSNHWLQVRSLFFHSHGMFSHSRRTPRSLHLKVCALIFCQSFMVLGWSWESPPWTYRARPILLFFNLSCWPIENCFRNHVLSRWIRKLNGFESCYIVYGLTALGGDVLQDIIWLLVVAEALPRSR